MDDILNNAAKEGDGVSRDLAALEFVSGEYGHISPVQVMSASYCAKALQKRSILTCTPRPNVASSFVTIPCLLA
jgi:hypothetical protein